MPVSSAVRWSRGRTARRAFLGVAVAAVIAWMGFYIYDGGTGVGPALAAANGGGTKGYFVAQTESCGKSCSWHGEFRLPDGRVTRHGVNFYGDTSTLHADDVLSAVDTGDSVGVFPRNDSLAWVRPMFELVLGALVCVLIMIVSLVKGVRRLRRWRGRKGLATGMAGPG